MFLRQHPERVDDFGRTASRRELALLGEYDGVIRARDCSDAGCRCHYCSRRAAEMFLRRHPERVDDFRRWVDYVRSHAHHNDHDVTVYHIY